MKHYLFFVLAFVVLAYQFGVAVERDEPKMGIPALLTAVLITIGLCAL
jgi:hypothetical protein